MLPQSGPTETKAALQFSVNTLEVENILVIGHSRCGGIQALMSMEDEGDSRNFIHICILVASDLHFDHQCQHCVRPPKVFEMSYNIWCGGCNSMIAKGV
ncbi:hypothetical protein Bca4012_008778 [Brassica carinata]